MAHRRDLQALQEHVRGQEVSWKAARRQRFPEPTLMAGWKRVEALDESDTGWVASLMVPVPLFDRGRFAAAHALVASDRLELRREILEREIRAQVTSALAGARAAQASLDAVESGAKRNAADLLRIAQVAYEEGELNIRELLDVHGDALQAELQILAVQHQARKARIDLERATGQEVNP
jgi:cobalt-zinc-cadmium efflux system outer membrane protein